MSTREQLKRTFGTHIDITYEGDIKRTVIKPLHARVLESGSRLTKEACCRATANFLEMVREVPWNKLVKNYMVQNLIALAILYKAGEPEITEFINKVDSLINPEGERPQPFSETIISQETVAIAQPLSYTIHHGDTLFSIARRFGVSVGAILEANTWIKDRNVIYSSQELTIPGIVSPEISAKDDYRPIVGKPPIYKMTEKDISFLNWLNSTHSYWQDWNRYNQRVYIPDWVYQYAKTAEVASDGHCNWTYLVGIGLTETGYFRGSQWNPEAISSAGARGIMQFMPGTFVLHAPYEDANPENPKDNMIAACNKIIFQKLTGEETQAGWVENFLGNGPTGAMWNAHRAQANNSWLLSRELDHLETMFDTLYERVISE